MASLYLNIFVKRCQSMRPIDTGMTTNDTFVVIQFRGQNQETETIDNGGRSPVFEDEYMEWSVGEEWLEEYGDEDVYVSVKDEGWIGSEVIGICTIKLREFLDMSEPKMFDVRHEGDICGQIFLAGNISNMTETYRRHLENPVPHVWMHCHGARGLPDKTSFFDQKPYLKAQVLGISAETHPAANSEKDPDWSGVCLRFGIMEDYADQRDTPVYLAVRAPGKIATIRLGIAQMTLGDFIDEFDHRWIPLSHGGEVCLSGRVNDYKKRQAEEAEAARVEEEIKRLEEEERKAAEAAAKAEADAAAAAEEAAAAAAAEAARLKELAERKAAAEAEQRRVEEAALAAEREHEKELERLQAQQEAEAAANEAADEDLADAKVEAEDAGGDGGDAAATAAAEAGGNGAAGAGAGAGAGESGSGVGIHADPSAFDWLPAFLQGETMSDESHEAAVAAVRDAAVTIADPAAEVVLLQSQRYRRVFEGTYMRGKWVMLMETHLRPVPEAVAKAGWPALPTHPEATHFEEGYITYKLLSAPDDDPRADRVGQECTELVVGYVLKHGGKHGGRLPRRIHLHGYRILDVNQGAEGGPLLDAGEYFFKLRATRKAVTLRGTSRTKGDDKWAANFTLVPAEGDCSYNLRRMKGGRKARKAARRRQRKERQRRRQARRQAMMQARSEGLQQRAGESDAQFERRQARVARWLARRRKKAEKQQDKRQRRRERRQRRRNGDEVESPSEGESDDDSDAERKDRRRQRRKQRRQRRKERRQGRGGKRRGGRGRGRGGRGRGRGRWGGPGGDDSSGGSTSSSSDSSDTSDSW